MNLQDLYKQTACTRIVQVFLAQEKTCTSGKILAQFLCNFFSRASLVERFLLFYFILFYFILYYFKRANRFTYITFDELFRYYLFRYYYYCCYCNCAKPFYDNICTKQQHVIFAHHHKPSYSANTRHTELQRL